MIPTGFSNALQPLRAAVRDAQKKPSPPNLQSCRKALVLFQAAVAGDPALSAELKRRAEYVFQQCQQGTAYCDAREAAWSHWQGLSHLPYKFNPRIDEALESLHLPSVSSPHIKQTPTLASELGLAWVLLEELLTLEGLSPEARAALERWRLLAVQIETEANNIGADGCRYLADQDWLAETLLRYSQFTPVILKAIGQAVGSLKEWTDNRPGKQKTAAGGDDPDQLLSSGQLADRLGIPANDKKKREALRKRLESWRNRNQDGGWIEVADRKPKQPGYLYPLGKVWSVIEDMKPSG